VASNFLNERRHSVEEEILPVIPRLPPAGAGAGGAGDDRAQGHGEHRTQSTAVELFMQE
jgi:hypothetical protein